MALAAFVIFAVSMRRGDRTAWMAAICKKGHKFSIGNTFFKSMYCNTR
jgi:hypothetical protein